MKEFKEINNYEEYKNYEISPLSLASNITSINHEKLTVDVYYLFDHYYGINMSINCDDIFLL